MSIDERLRQAADQVNHDLERTPIPIVPTRASTPWLTVATAVVVTLLAVGSVVWLLGPGESGGEVTTREATTVPPPTTTGVDDGTLFGEPADVVLLFDDGIDGVLAVDPDGRLAARSVVEGQLAGDQMPRLHRSGDHLVVGWSSITAVDIATREATSLGNATIAIPAVEAGRVWLIDFEGGHIGQGNAVAWQVVVATGRALTDPVPIDIDGIPVTGVAGGLAFDTDDGVVLWYGDGAARRLGEGDGRGTVIDVHRNRIAWCSGDCATLHVTDIYGGDHAYTGPFEPGTGRFSPDGRLIAFLSAGVVQVHDIQAETVEPLGRLADSSPGGGYLGWSPDGEQLFASTYAYGQRTMQVLRYRLADGGLDTVTLPFGGALDFVVLDRDEAGAYFGSDIEEVCGQTGGLPGNREGICTFEF